MVFLIGNLTVQKGVLLNFMEIYIHIHIHSLKYILCVYKIIYICIHFGIT